MPTPVIVSHVVSADPANHINPSVVLPATVNAGDLVLIAVGYGAAAITFTVNQGFTKVDTRTFSTTSTLELWGKTCAGTEGGQTVTFTTTLNRAYTFDVIRITGAKALSAHPHATGSTNVASLSHTGVAVTTITDNALLIGFIRMQTGAAAPVTAPSGWTKLDEGVNVGGSIGTLTSATRTLVAHGVSDANPWTSSSSSQSVQLTIGILDASADAAPTAIAGPDQSAVPGATVQLVGSGTDPDGTVVGYAWTCTAAYGDGTATTDPVLSSSTAQNPTFTAPAHDRGVYIFSLTVTDDQGAPSTNTAKTAVFVDASLASGVFPRAAGAWNTTGVMKVRRSGTFDTVTI